MILPDIDIDFPDTQKALETIKHIKASRVEQHELVKHNSGIYLNRMPIDDCTGLSAIPYKEAESRGYFKIDFLTNHVYKSIKSEEHLDSLINTIPIWDILDDKDLVSELFQIGNHFDIVKKIKPRNVQDLALTIAIIRPGKRHLLNCKMDYIREHIWEADDSGYIFKKSHAISYAMVIVVQMNLMMETLNDEE